MSSLMTTTECVVADFPSEDKAGGMGGMGGMDY